MGLADYLAQNYLSAEKPAKKRKRKDKASKEGLTIEDDEAQTWTNPNHNNEDDEDAPTIVGTLAGGLNKPAKKSKWIKIGTEAPKDSEQAAADAILADAQAESRARAQQDDDDPTLVGENGADYDGPVMANGALAGLQTAAQVSKALKRKQKAEMKAMQDADLASGGLAQQTIYRDASGRMINVKQKQDEAAEKAREEERKAKEEAESGKGDVQRREKEARRRDLEEAKIMPVARRADDEKMNAELKDRERWNDPMAQLLATKKSSSSKTSKTGKNKSSGKTYQGAFEPNRYGIRPGWRWDGVDRGNGFERKWFAARNAKKDKEALRIAWEEDL